MSETIDYNRLVSMIFKQLNFYRSRPRELIVPLENRLKMYDDKKFMPTGDPSLVIHTQEGAQAVEELIESLRQETKYSQFAWSHELHLAANLKADQLSAQSRGGTGEVTEDVEELVGKFAQWSGSLSELIVYGLCDPDEIICELLIDDGNIERDNRKQFFNPSLHNIGIGIDTHAKYQFVVIFILATGVSKKTTYAKKPHTNRFVPPKLEEDQENANCRGCNLF